LLTYKLLLNILKRVVVECRRRFGETAVELVKERRGKYEIYMRIGNRRVKVIVSKNLVEVRVYSRLTGMDISLRRIFAKEYEKELRLRRSEEKPI